MNEDMPWVIGLTDEEVQELRSKKQELTQYGKEKIRELMTDGKLRFYDKGKETFAVEDPYWGGRQSPETQLHIKEMTHEEMLEEAERRENEQNEELEDAQKWIEQNFQQEAANKALEALDKLYDEHSGAFEQLAAIESKELIDEALEELNAIVMGGQDTREFYNSVKFIKDVLNRLR